MFGNIWNIIGIIIDLMTIFYGAYIYFFPGRRVPSGNREKIAKIKLLGLMLSLVGIALLVSKLSSKT
jgi:hypothetical protein